MNQGGGAYECTQVIVEDTQGAELTKEEEIAALEGALHDSIDRFESCVGDVDLSGSGQGAGSGSGSGAGVKSWVFVLPVNLSASARFTLK